MSVTGLVLAVPEITIGDRSFSCVYSSVLVMIALAVAAVVVCRRVSDRHQVM